MREFNKTHLKLFYTTNQADVILTSITTKSIKPAVVKYPNGYRMLSLVHFTLDAIDHLPNVQENLRECQKSGTSDEWVLYYKKPKQDYMFSTKFERLKIMRLTTNKLRQNEFVKQFNSSWQGKVFKENL